MAKKDWSWAILGLLALGIRWLAIRHPEATEEIYSHTFFPVIRNVFDLTLGNLPFPSVYLFIFLIFFLLGRFILLLRKKNSLKRKSLFTLRAFLNFAGGLIFFFLVLWGYNYHRVPVFRQLGLEPKALNLDKLTQEIQITHRLARQNRYQLTRDTIAIEEILGYSDLEQVVRENMHENLELLGLNFTGNPRTKLFPPPGFMRKMGILGIYFPFTGESYIDPTLHPLEQPFTVAHEMAHSYGVTDEGEANFIAWVISTNSPDPLLRYSGHLRLLLYQIRDFYRMDSEGYKDWLKNLDIGIRNDIQAIQMRTAQYQPFSIELSRKTNDVFLKSQGVKAGINSYQQLPMLAYAWRERMNN